MEYARIKMKKSVAVTVSVAFGLAITLFVTMLLFNVTDYGITLASFGASIFMILSDKKLKKRVIFGSYLIASLLGFMFSRISGITALNMALAAITSIILMTILNMQHAPAIGFAAAMILNKFSFLTDVIIFICLFIIIGMAFLLKIALKNPEKILRFIEIDEERIKWNLPKREPPQYFKLKHPAKEDE